MELDYIDFEIYEVLHLADWELDTQVFIRVYGEVDNKVIDFDNEIIAPKSINTYEELSVFIANLLSHYYVNAEETEIGDLIKSNWLMNVEGVN